MVRAISDKDEHIIFTLLDGKPDRFGGQYASRQAGDELPHFRQ